MILFSLQCDRLFLALNCFGSHNLLTFKINWQQITGLKHGVTGFSHAEES